jgi:signal transduction histidine kinase
VTIPGKLFRTTAFKLSLAFLALSAIGSGVVLGIVGWQVIAVVDQEMTQTIEAEANGLSEQYDQGGIRRLGLIIEERSREPGSSLYLLTSPAGEPLAGNVARLPSGALDRPGFLETPYEIVDASPPGRRALARIFVLPGGFRRVLRRIDAMSNSSRAIMAGDLTQRLPVLGSGDELDRLALNLNDMLARIGELMAGLREVSDNIAHDLRTPLTRLRNHAEEALRAAGDAQTYRAALERTIEESDGLIKIFNALLMIARAEAGAGHEGTSEFDVGAAVRGIAELYEPVAEEQGVSLRVDIEPGLRLLGNRELIGQTLANLVDNALKYGAGDALPALSAPGGQRPALAALKEVSLSVRRVGANVEIAVGDHGPGVAPGDRSRVLDRFVRLEGARSRPGSGLGLSLAAAVVGMHMGSVRLEDNHPGLRIVVALPLTSAAPTLLARPAPSVRIAVP